MKEYIKPIRQALHAAFLEARLKLDPFAVLVSEPAETKEIHYRLKATVDWIHIDCA